MAKFDLTSQGIQKLIDQLDADATSASTSSLIDEDTKKRIKDNTKSLKDFLGKAKNNLPLPTSSGWASLLTTVGATFGTLSSDLQSSEPAVTVIGACFYTGGCAVMTQLQCKALGGDFKANQPCPPPPPP